MKRNLPETHLIPCYTKGGSQINSVGNTWVPAQMQNLRPHPRPTTFSQDAQVTGAGIALESTDIQLWF